MAEIRLAGDVEYQQLLGRISDAYTIGRVRANQSVNAQIIETYWQIGHDIVEFEQGGRFVPTTAKHFFPASAAT